MKYRKHLASFLATFFITLTFLHPFAASESVDSILEEDTSVVTEETSTYIDPLREPVFQRPFEVQAEAVYFVNADTGLVMYSKNAEKTWAPASLTKMITAIVVMEYVEDLDAETATMPRYVQDELYGTGSSLADIRVGETLTIRQLLYALLLQSANEAAMILADYVAGGSTANFVFMMNTKAKAIGCTNTNFTNPHGLYDVNQYTTAYDQYLVAKYIYDNYPELMEIMNANTYEMPGTPFHEVGSWIMLNTNKMQMTAFRENGFYREYIRGMKTGSLPESGFNFVSSATLDGENYIMVVLGATGDSYPAFYVTADLYDWAFQNFSVKLALDTSQPTVEVPVKYSTDVDMVLLYPAEDFLTVLPNESDETTLQRVYNLPESAPAPIKEGDVIGTVTLYLAEQEIGTVNLIAKTDIKRNWFLFVLAKIGEFMSSLYFKVVVVLALIALAIYLYYIYRVNKHQEEIRKIKRRRNKFDSK